MVEGSHSPGADSPPDADSPPALDDLRLVFADGDRLQLLVDLLRDETGLIGVFVVDDAPADADRYRARPIHRRIHVRSAVGAVRSVERTVRRGRDFDRAVRLRRVLRANESHLRSDLRRAQSVTLRVAG